MRATRLSSPRRSSAPDAVPPPRDNQPVIPRYTRPALGELWTDEARMETWRRVEVACCEELAGLLGEDGPSEGELEAIRRASFTVEAVNEREQVTDHDMAAFVDVLAESAGGPVAGSTTA